jgi:hypothetical protein
MQAQTEYFQHDTLCLQIDVGEEKVKARRTTELI